MNPVVSASSGFLVEDFLEAITSQLDRTQDALRFKSVNRPLTYAIRDFSLELKVFVELGADGKVRFRASGPSEDGASSVQIGFTTVTRPMIEENTVSLSTVRSPTLDELGLNDDEQKGLERLGVRNAAQLIQLGRVTGERAVSRVSGLPVDRLRAALQNGRPSVSTVRPLPARPAVPAAPVQVAPISPARPPARTVPSFAGLPVRELPRNPETAPAPQVSPGELDPLKAPAVRIPAGTRKIHIAGNLLPEQVTGARLGRRPVAIRAVADGLEVDLGDRALSGTLALDLDSESAIELPIEFEADRLDSEPAAQAQPEDPVVKAPSQPSPGSAALSLPEDPVPADLAAPDDPEFSAPADPWRPT